MEETQVSRATGLVERSRYAPLSVWTRKRPEAQRIQKALVETEDEIRRFVCECFPDAVWTEEVHSWRYTETGPEPMPFDVCADPVERPVVRVFVNLHTQARVWDLGPIAKGPDDGTDLVYKARDRRARRAHRVCTGALWIVDSRRVAHAIIHGRRGGDVLVLTVRCYDA